MPISPRTDSCPGKRLSRVFMDLGGKRHVTSVGGNKCLMIVRNDFSRHAWVLPRRLGRFWLTSE